MAASMQGSNSGAINVRCPNCGQQFTAFVESIVDAGRDPAAKARFLSGRTNVVQCPNCGAVSQLAIPFVYHDHEKELMLVFFPPQLNVPTQERERIIGEMSRAIMNSLPQDARKGYLLNPITPLTLQGMIEMILEKEGVTKEMIAEQQEKMKLVERFLNVDPGALQAMVEQHDEELNAEFFQLMTLAAQSALASGDEQAAQGILQRRDEVLMMSSYGQEAMENMQQQEQVVQEVAGWIQQQGQSLSIEALLDYVEEIGESDNHLQAMVGLIRPVFNYQFFEMLNERIEKADPEKAEVLEDTRERLLELTQMIDQRQQMLVQQAQTLLRELLNAEDQEAAIQDALPFVDDMFLSVLAATVQRAEQQGDLMTAARVKSLYEKIIEQLQASAPPEVRFINELLSQEDDLEARLLLSEHAAEYGEPLLQYMDAVLGNLEQQGANEMYERLVELRDATEKILDEQG